MEQTSTMTRPPPKTDILVPAIERLQQVLGEEFPGHEREWAINACGALVGLKAILQKHQAVTEAEDGMFTEVDLTRPTLVRRVGHLRQDHLDFLERTGALQGELRCAARAFQKSGNPKAAPAPLPEPAA